MEPSAGEADPRRRVRAIVLGAVGAAAAAYAYVAVLGLDARVRYDTLRDLLQANACLAGSCKSLVTAGTHGLVHGTLWVRLLMRAESLGFSPLADLVLLTVALSLAAGLLYATVAAHAKWDLALQSAILFVALACACCFPEVSNGFLIFLPEALLYFALTRIASGGDLRWSVLAGLSLFACAEAHSTALALTPVLLWVCATAPHRAGWHATLAVVCDLGAAFILSRDSYRRNVDGQPLMFAGLIGVSLGAAIAGRALRFRWLRLSVTGRLLWLTFGTVGWWLSALAAVVLVRGWDLNPWYLLAVLPPLAVCLSVAFFVAFDGHSQRPLRLVAAAGLCWGVWSIGFASPIGVEALGGTVLIAGWFLSTDTLRRPAVRRVLMGLAALLAGDLLFGDRALPLEVVFILVWISPRPVWVQRSIERPALVGLVMVFALTFDRAGFANTLPLAFWACAVVTLAARELPFSLVRLFVVASVAAALLQKVAHEPLVGAVILGTFVLLLPRLPSWPTRWNLSPWVAPVFAGMVGLDFTRYEIAKTLHAGLGWSLVAMAVVSLIATRFVGTAAGRAVICGAPMMAFGELVPPWMPPLGLSAGMLAVGRLAWFRPLPQPVLWVVSAFLGCFSLGVWLHVDTPVLIATALACGIVWLTAHRWPLALLRAFAVAIAASALARRFDAPVPTSLTVGLVAFGVVASMDVVSRDLFRRAVAAAVCALVVAAITRFDTRWTGDLWRNTWTVARWTHLGQVLNARGWSCDELRAAEGPGLWGTTPVPPVLCLLAPGDSAARAPRPETLRIVPAAWKELPVPGWEAIELGRGELALISAQRPWVVRNRGLGRVTKHGQTLTEFALHFYWEAPLATPAERLVADDWPWAFSRMVHPDRLDLGDSELQYECPIAITGDETERVVSVINEGSGSLWKIDGVDGVASTPGPSPFQVTLKRSAATSGAIRFIRHVPAAPRFADPPLVLIETTPSESVIRSLLPLPDWSHESG